MIRIFGIALFVSMLLQGCSALGPSSPSPFPAAQRPASESPRNGIAPQGRRAKQLLYVLVNSGTYSSYVAIYNAYAKNPQMIGKISDGLQNPGAIWVDAKGHIFVGNDMTYTSSVTEYAPGTNELVRSYTNGIDLPFGGTVDPEETMYVSVAGVKGHSEGGIAVFPPHKSSPSTILTDNIYVPHGVAKDPSGNLFVAEIYGLQSYVVEFPAGSTNSTILPLKDLNTGAFLEDLKLDQHNDIVVADANLNAVRFYPPPYKKESKALSAGLSAPTALAYGADGSLFVGNEYAGTYGNVVVFAPGTTKPSRTITNGISGGVLGVAISPAQ
jgi:hypothetical protein